MSIKRSAQRLAVAMKRRPMANGGRSHGRMRSASLHRYGEALVRIAYRHQPGPCRRRHLPRGRQSRFRGTCRQLGGKGRRADHTERRLDGSDPPELFRGSARRGGRPSPDELHEAIGCVSTFTCAPYQTLFRPRPGRRNRLGRIERHRLRQLSSARAPTAMATYRPCRALPGRVPRTGLPHSGEPAGEIVFVLPARVAAWPGDALGVRRRHAHRLSCGSAIPSSRAAEYADRR